MDDPADWRLSLKFATRVDSIQKISKGLVLAGRASGTDAQSAAYAAEREAYIDSPSREVYDAVCSTLAATEVLKADVVKLSSEKNSLEIGSYRNCHHVASGIASDVYRSDAVALKVISEVRDIEPHNPRCEIKILQQLSHRSIIKLLATSKDSDDRLILVFPYMHMTLFTLLASGSPLKNESVQTIFSSIFSALSYLHNHGIIHRDVKPSNILLSSDEPALDTEVKLCDFGTAWHPTFSARQEPPTNKTLEVGTTCYRAPETLFGNRTYDTSLDMWSVGCVLVECLRDPPTPLFESRSTEEDGNQLGLVLSMFKTLGTPTKKTWPEAVDFSTPPFDWYQKFVGRPWRELLPGVHKDMLNLVEGLLVYESGARFRATEAMKILTKLNDP